MQNAEAQIRALNRNIYLLNDSPNDTVTQSKFRYLFDSIHSKYLGKFGNIFFNEIEAPQAEKPNSRFKSFLIKPVSDGCNLRCTYCYENGEDYQPSAKKMNYAALEKTVKDILENSYETAVFLWHGGEPMLPGLNYYKKAVALQQQYNIYNSHIINSIQTNATLLNDDWYAFLKEYNFNVSISFDGPKPIHDLHRIKGKNRGGTYDDLVQKFRELHEAEIPFHTIAVINNQHKNGAEDFYNEILKYDIRSFDLHPNFQDVHNHVDANVFADFVIGVYNLWKNDPVQREFNLVNDFLNYVIMGQPEACYFSGRCTEITAIDGNGDFTPCTRPFDKSTAVFGNIHQSNIQSITENINFQNFLRDDMSAVAKVESCKWGKACNNGCPQHRLGNDNKASLSGQSVFCSCNNAGGGGYFKIWEYIFSDLNRIFSPTETILQEEAEITFQ